MNAVWKFPLTGDQTRVKMPTGATVLTAQIQGSHVTLWATVNPDAPVEIRTFRVIGTGWEFDANITRYIGTVQDHQFVWHIFEENRLA